MALFSQGRKEVGSSCLGWGRVELGPPGPGGTFTGHKLIQELLFPSALCLHWTLPALLLCKRGLSQVFVGGGGVCSERSLMEEREVGAKNGQVHASYLVIT